MHLVAAHDRVFGAGRAARRPPQRRVLRAARARGGVAVGPGAPARGPLRAAVKQLVRALKR